VSPFPWVFYEGKGERNKERGAAPLLNTPLAKISLNPSLRRRDIDWVEALILGFARSSSPFGKGRVREGFLAARVGIDLTGGSIIYVKRDK